MTPVLPARKTKRRQEDRAEKNERRRKKGATLRVCPASSSFLSPFFVSFGYGGLGCGRRPCWDLDVLARNLVLGVSLTYRVWAENMGELEHKHHELELLRLLAQGEKEIEAGKGYDLDTVFAEADALLRKMSRRKHLRTNEQ